MSKLKRHLLCLNPTDGKLLWNTEVPAEMPEQDRIRENHGYASSTPVAQDGIVYVIGGRSPNGTLAIRAGGRGDVTASHVAWKAGKGRMFPHRFFTTGIFILRMKTLGSFIA